MLARLVWGIGTSRMLQNKKQVRAAKFFTQLEVYALPTALEKLLLSARLSEWKESFLVGGQIPGWCLSIRDEEYKLHSFFLDRLGSYNEVTYYNLPRVDWWTGFRFYEGTKAVAQLNKRLQARKQAPTEVQ